MHPLKLASRAYVNHGGNGDTYNSFREEDQRDADEAMRAALMALVECELDPDGDLVVKATLEAEDSDTGSTNEHILFAFKAILRSIANEGKTDG